MTAKLTKKYLFPLVKGTSFGMSKIGHSIKSAFVNFILKSGGIIEKISNFHPTMNHYLRTKVLHRSKLVMFGNEYKACEKANKYLNKQYRRLAELLRKGDIIGYSCLFYLLMKRSDLFLLAIFVRKLPFYATNYSVNKVYHLKKEIRKLLTDEKNQLKIKRIFLEEFNSDGSFKKFRPLGVPDVRWRVILAMYEMYLVNLYAADWKPNQYACMPKKGVVDAWIAILSELDDKKNIVGVDLAKFFDTVFLDSVRTCLWLKQIPDRILDNLSKINERTAQVFDEDREKERDRLKALNKEAPIELDERIRVKPRYEKDRSKRASLPQGANTSPFLACLVLGRTGALDIKSASVYQYVDDAVLIGESDTKTMIKEYKENLLTLVTGITLSEKKTEIIRENGKWIKPLKFLGCEYDGETFRAHTRSNGVYEVKDASSRIKEIIKWLHLNRGNIKEYERRDLSMLINEGWNRSGRWMLLNPRRDLTQWEYQRIVRTKVMRNSVEAEVIRLLVGTPRQMILGSTNVSSMMCAGTVLLGRKLARELSRPTKVDRIESKNPSRGLIL